MSRRKQAKPRSCPSKVGDAADSSDTLGPKTKTETETEKDKENEGALLSGGNESDAMAEDDDDDDDDDDASNEENEDENAENEENEDDDKEESSHKQKHQIVGDSPRERHKNVQTSSPDRTQQQQQQQSLQRSQQQQQQQEEHNHPKAAQRPSSGGASPSTGADSVTEGTRNRKGSKDQDAHRLEGDKNESPVAPQDGFDDLSELEEDDDDDYDDLEDDDLRSLDSFYSDIYSTHTSSSYSPSVSDGTITPNSLPAAPGHHHSQHLPHHLPLHGLPANYLADEDGGLQRYTGKTNGGGGGGGEDDAGEINIEQKSSNRRVDGHDLSAGTVLAVEQLKRHGGHHRHTHHHLRLPSKLRKMDRATARALSGALKFDKSTVDGISGGAGGGVGGGGANSDGSYQCQFCDKSFPRLGYLKKHEQSHAEHLPFKCDYCARLFKHKRSRDRHTKLHTGDRRYRCPHCESAFSRSDHLKIHMKTHDNQKPFQCTICNRGYNTAAALTSHMQNHKKQAAILAAGGHPQALIYSPRSSGSASSSGGGGSQHKRRYALSATAAAASSTDGSSTAGARYEYATKRARIGGSTPDHQLHANIQAVHEREPAPSASASAHTPTSADASASAEASPTQPITATAQAAGGFQLACEYCTMRLPNIPAMFQHIRSAHIDRLSSPNSYFEHFNRLAASGTFSPRLGSAPARLGSARALAATSPPVGVIKQEQEHSSTSPNTYEEACSAPVEEEPTDLSRSKRQAKTPELQYQQQQKGGSNALLAAPGLFFCSQCNAGLPDFDSFRGHLKSHLAQSGGQGQGAAPLVCHHCGLVVREPAEYERHVIAHFLITSTEYLCSSEGCKNVYAKHEELQKHLGEQHTETVYRCGLCSDLFESKMAIQVHFACAHSVEERLLRCSACMETFRTETDFAAHVRARHHQSALNGLGVDRIANTSSSPLQCMFCRTVCASELEMHFHLAAHARQFRCPSCPETFHVEFLLDRHMESQHGGERGPPPPSKEVIPFEDVQPPPPSTSSSADMSSTMNSLYVNALFGKAGPLAAPTPSAGAALQNNNSSILDYNVAFAAHLNKGLFPTGAAGKLYSPLQVDTNALKHPHPHPALMYAGLSQRYFDTNRALVDMYTQQQHQQVQQDKVSVAAAAAAAAAVAGSYFLSPPTKATEPALHRRTPPSLPPSPLAAPSPGFSCDVCERNDFRTEAEVHSHRKIVHNMKTGVSLRCAYCAGNFKSRNELEHHMKTCHNSTGKHKCLICDEIFPSPAILAEHKLQHSKVGQSGKCSHCSRPLDDAAAFKAHLLDHNGEGQMPVQCVCCRQSLHSDFEVGLHAKFHTKATVMVPESVCALCLMEPVPATNGEAKVCEKCCRKHNLSAKYAKQQHHLQKARDPVLAGAGVSTGMGDISSDPTRSSTGTHFFEESRCNLCKLALSHPTKLREHLVEHTFAGCEERGYTCYMCSAVFTAPGALLIHMAVHGSNARPYDCGLCTEKFFFRAELDHHMVEHERHDIECGKEDHQTHKTVRDINETQLKRSEVITTTSTTTATTSSTLSQRQQVKKEMDSDHSDKTLLAPDDDEYIEVEQVAEPNRSENLPADAIEDEKGLGRLEKSVAGETLNNV